MKRISPLLVALVLVGCGTDVSGPSSSLFSCVFGEPLSIPVGQAVQVRGAGNQGVCLADDEDAGFVYIPFFGSADSAGDLSVALTGAGLSGAGASNSVRGIEPGPVLGALRSRRPVRDSRFHDELRRREIRELEPRIRPGSPSPRDAPVLMESRAAADVPTVGERRDFNVAISCEDVDLRTGEVMYVSNNAVVYADTANPAQLTSQDYAYFGVTFDTLVHPLETSHFGEPSDIDENERAILFFTRAVNERNPPGSESLTIGFFWSGDLFPETDTDRLQACQESNHGEMFYLVAPDPMGQAGVAFTLQDVRDLAIPLIGHEYQHLINASRRLFVNNASRFEIGWLNEGLSHAAEELLFLEVAGLQLNGNIGIGEIRNAPGPADSLFNEYMGSNFSNFAKFLSRPDTASLMGPADKLATRGAIWSFLSYAAHRSGNGEFYYDLVNSQTAGLDNLDEVIGGGAALSWMRDWAVSVYADDLLVVEPRFVNGTWNLRSLYENSSLNGYPLQPATLGSGETTTAQLSVGGISFNGFGVTAGHRGTLHVEADGGTPPRTLRGSFLRVR